MDDEVTPELGRTAWATLETLHVVAYFAPDVQQAYDAFGVTATRAGYFASRAAALGPVPAAVVTATFGIFAPRLVAAAVPAVWAAAPPERWAAARAEATATALHRVLGEPDVTEAVDLARTACAGLTAHGRPLFAAWSDWPEPDDPLLQLWHAALLVREHRGDGHLSAWLAAGLDPVEALITSGLSSGSVQFVRTTRGWTDEEWAAGVARLHGRGLVTPDGAALTERGVVTRAQVELTTDELSVEGWAHLGPEGTSRLVELLTPLRRAVADSGLLPDWVRARR